MSLEIFVSDYAGAVGDQVHTFLIANTTGTSSTWATGDLWLKFFAERGYTTGTVQDRTRRFLIDYLGVVDVGQTVNDLWESVALPYSIGSLFTAGEQGVWYDPNDLTTLFQDSAGTTPVTAAGQPVGLMLDKRLGQPAARRNLLTYTDQLSNAAWTKNSVTVVDGIAAKDGSLTATRVTATGGNSSLWGVVSAVAGQAITQSFLIKNNDVNTPLRAGISNTSFSEVAFTDLVTSATWTQHTVTLTPTTTGTYYVFFGAFETFQVGESFEVCCIQLELGDTATEYQRVTSASGGWTTGNHASQSTAASRPMLRDTPRRVDYDAVDDVLNVTFPSALGSACTVARSIPGVGAQILTAQTIGTSFTDNVDNCGLIIVNRALTPTETANLTRYLNQRAGV